MARLPVQLFLLASFSCAALSFDVRGRITWNEHCVSTRELGSAKVMLDEGLLQGSVMKNGSFVIPDVPNGTYILSVGAHNHTFEQLRIDVHPELTVPEVRPYVPGTPLNPPSTVSLPYPITLSPRQQLNFFIPREGFNLFGMFQNPMMLMMAFGGIMMFAMPYLMKNLDPEAVDEIQARQAKAASIQQSMLSGDFKAGLSAIMGPEDSTPQASSSAMQPKIAAPTTSRKGTNKNKRR